MGIKLVSGKKVITRNVVIYENIFMKFFGLRFSNPLKDEAVVFVNRRESRINSIVDMFFVGFPLDVLWLDKNMRVVDKAVMKPFQIRKPKQKAMYIIELKKGKADNLNIGDKLRIY